MGQWWNNADRGKIKYSEINLSERHLPHSGSFMDRYGIEPRAFSERRQLTTLTMARYKKLSLEEYIGFTLLVLSSATGEESKII